MELSVYRENILFMEEENGQKNLNQCMYALIHLPDQLNLPWKIVSIINPLWILSVHKAQVKQDSHVSLAQTNSVPFRILSNKQEWKY